MAVALKKTSDQVQPTVSVVIPALNEAGNIGLLVRSFLKQFQSLNLSNEIVIVDGGSKDETRAIAEENGARTFLQRRIGYGGALREGFGSVTGEYVLTLDADCSHPPEQFDNLWNSRNLADIIIASRFIKGGDSKAPFFRQILSIILNWVFSSLLRLPIKDSSSGYRLYRRGVLVPKHYTPENFNILQEVLVRAYCDGFTIKEVPLQYQERASGSSHVSLFKFAVSYVPTLYRLWKLRNSPEAAPYEYESYDSRHPLQRYWIRKRISYLKEFTSNPKALLDVGSGSSVFITGYPQGIAFDCSEAKLRFLKNKGVQTACGDAHKLPFPDESFDHVVLSNVLNYVEDAAKVVAEARRVLKHNGTLLVAVPDISRLNWRIVRLIYRVLPNVKRSSWLHDFTRSSLADLLAENGFRCLTYRYVLGAELIMKCSRVE